MQVRPEETVHRYLPRVLRGAGPDSAAFQLTRALGLQLEDLARQSRRLFYARYLTETANLEDLSRLAAPMGLEPWRYEDPQPPWAEELTSFRARVLTMLRIYMNGPVTAAGMLTVVGVAAAGYPARLPAPWSPGVINASGPLTWCEYNRPGTSDRFQAGVLDFPVRLTQSQAAKLDWQSTWTITAPTNLPARPPVIDITAGDQPLTAPIFLQRDLQRMVLVNRCIQPHATCRADLVGLTVRDLAGTPSQPGPVIGASGTVEADLYFTDGGLLNDDVAGKLPFPLLRWNHSLGTDDAWQSLVTAGESRWRLLTPTVPAGQKPAPDGKFSPEQVEGMPPTGGLPQEVVFRWDHHSDAGTFTIMYRKSDREPWIPSLGFPEQSWLDQQIRRLKVAGVQFIAPEQTLLR